MYSRTQRTVKVLFYENKMKIKYQIVLKKGVPSLVMYTKKKKAYECIIKNSVLYKCIGIKAVQSPFFEF